MATLLLRLSVALCAAYAVASPALAQTQPSPAPTPAPVPNITWQTNLSAYTFKTNNPNATGALDTADGRDTGSRTDYSNIIVAVTRNTGLFRFGAIVGEYALPVLGQAINPTGKLGSNTDLFGIAPVAYVQYVPNASWTFTAGKLSTLLGQESNFTFQDVNVQRGLAWNQETAFSRGLRATYTAGKFTGNLEYNDGFYSGRLNAVEGLAAWAASPNTTLQFAFVVPQTNMGPNPTAGIANKREGDLMLTQQFGKLQLMPYLLWLDSPQNTSIGFNGDERAFAGVMIANYVFGSDWSLGARYEAIANRSNNLDLGANSDMVGFGPGSKATSWTLTPQFKTGHTTVRGEYSAVNLGAFTPGLGFGPAGTNNSQSRLGLEIGVQF